MGQAVTATYDPKSCYARAGRGPHEWVEKVAKCVDIDVDVQTCMHCGVMFVRAALQVDANLEPGYISDWVMPVSGVVQR